MIVSSKENYIVVYNGMSKFYVPIENHNYNLFDIVLLEGEIRDYSFNFYEGMFDFNEYLRSKFIYKEIELKRIERIVSIPLSNIKLYKILIDKLNEEGKIVVSELLFSKDYSSTYSSFISNNKLFYLLNLSSLHIYYLSYVLRGILETKFKDKTVDKILLIAYGVLVFINSFKISLLRFFIYQFVNVILKYKKIELSYIKKTMITLILLGIIDQSYFYSTSFLYHLLIPLNFLLTTDCISTFKYKYKNMIRMITLHIVIFFISLLIDESFSIFSLILTLLFTFVVLILLCLSLLSYILPLGPLINFISKGLLNVFSLIQNIEIKIYLSNSNFVFFVFFIILYFLILFSYENKIKILKKLSIFLFVFNIIASQLPLNYHNDNGVYFINVGQGDSILIHQDNTNILVDTGGIKNIDVACEILIPFFKKKNIYHLDYLFITHNDFDHNGGFESLVNNFNVKDYNKTNAFSSISIDHLEFINLNPSKKTEDNDDSLVLYFLLEDTSFLLLGDISKSVEEKIVDEHPELDVDVLKVGHHGSSTSTSDKLLSTYSIDVAIISCSKNNYYGHPSNEVLGKLTKYQILIRRTDEEGTIHIKV